MAPPNVVIFGETGSGKSSLINMIAGEDVADTSSKAIGCTFKTTPYDVIVESKSYKLFDTAGLNEWEGGRVSAKEAVTNLYQLFRSLDEGVCLLVYCVRGPRIKDNTVKNYQLFYEAICQKRVPIVIAVTGLENEDPLEGWWKENEDTLTRFGMKFDGHACVTATMGKREVFREDYEDSTKKMRDLIEVALHGSPWKVERTGWFITTIAKVWNLFSKAFDLPPFGLSKMLSLALEAVEVPPKEAKDIADRFELGRTIEFGE